jgi:S-DNA-T family DNA segregation ATPase FtsK/SpoIIIE
VPGPRGLSVPHDDHLKRDLIAIAVATLGALILVSLLYGGDGMGAAPAALAALLRVALGVGAFGVPALLLVIAALYGFESRPAPHRGVIIGGCVVLLSILAFLQVRVTGDHSAVFSDPGTILEAGGYIGAALGWVLLATMGQIGAYLFLSAAAFAGTVLFTQSTARELMGHLGTTVVRGAGLARQKAHSAGEVTRLGKPDVDLSDDEPEPQAPGRGGRSGKRKAQVDLDETEAPRVTLRPTRTGEGAAEADPGNETAELPAVTEQDVAVESAAQQRPRRRKSSGGGRAKVAPVQPKLLRNSDLFVLPGLDLLTAYADSMESAAMREEAAEQIIKLEDTLSSFGIAAKVSHYERGPVLTRYEVEPERGIRVNQVVRLADDLAMALAAYDVRVEAPIPGKSAIGIEVPNETRVTVGLRGILESDRFQEHPSKLAVALGRDIAGHPVVADITTMPHLLIAGATGSGKSVCLHGIIMSLLMRATPDEVRFIMVDPKRVELAVYDGIPHLLSPVVHSVKQAADVLRKAIREMEKRYDKFAVKGVVNLAEYNALAEMPKEHAVDEFEPLPHVVIIIDELADLMMQARAEFEFSICRIAQLARATGIHLVLATQRPSVKVVTGNIKANVPTRIALAVASQVDSRTILDGQGAERLIGRGDMLYSPLDASKPRRIQGAFVARGDIERVVEHLRTQGEPQFDIIPETPEEEEDFGDDLDTSDELYAAAVQYVVQEQEASVSMIQRRFKVGYARAGRLVDMMEQRGVVGPHEGSKPRQVLVGPHSMDAILKGRRPLGPNADDEQETEADVLMVEPQDASEEPADMGEESWTEETSAPEPGDE